MIKYRATITKNGITPIRLVKVTDDQNDYAPEYLDNQDFGYNFLKNATHYFDLTTSELIQFESEEDKNRVAIVPIATHV